MNKSKVLIDMTVSYEVYTVRDYCHVFIRASYVYFEEKMKMAKSKNTLFKFLKMFLSFLSLCVKSQTDYCLFLLGVVSCFYKFGTSSN